MTARKVIGVLAFGLALAIPPAANAQFRQAASGQRYVPGEAIVRFAPGVPADERREARGDARVSFEQSLGLPRAQVVSFDGSVGAAIRRLEDEPGVAYAQPNYRYHALAPVPNDTHFGHLWGLSGAPASVDVLPAWDRSRGAGQVIAILDTGVDLTHPDLAGNLWTGPGGIHGMDFVDGDTHPDDFNLHGTHVAGTAAAIADNGAGVAGVAPQAQIMAVRVLDGDGGGTTDDIVDGIDFAAANGASVINMSLGGPSDAGDTAMANAISAAAQNVVVVAAAGNEAADNDQVPTTPCTFGNANLICVAAVTRTGARSGFSNFGRTTVDLGAPGGTGSGDPDSDVLSAKPSWSVPLFSDDFDSGIAAWTPTGTGDTWGVETGAGVDGSDAVTDSPGALYQNNTNSQLQHDAIDLSGQRGCLLDFLLALEGVEDGADFVGVGVVSGAGEFGVRFTGDSGGFYQGTTISVAGVERDDAKPTLRFNSDAATRGDGAYIDDLNLICRAESYNDEIAADDTAVTGDSYTAIAGTSMAAPHVAGVAALVRAVDPGAPPSQVVDALRQGAKPAFGMVGVTVTGGVVDAVGAIDSALAIANEPPPPPPPPPPTATPPNRPRFGKVSVNRRGVVTVVVRGDAATTGVLTLAANITRPRRPTTARVRRVGRKRFRIGSARRARVRVKLIRPARRQLARRHTLRLRVRAVVTNAAGLSNSRTARIRITQRRRR